VAAYITLNLTISGFARRDVERAEPGGFDHIVASPAPVAFWRRDVVWVNDQVYRRARFDPLRDPRLSSDGSAVSSNIGDPLVADAIKASPRIAQFMRWSIMPMATIKRSRCFATVTFNDARYSNGLSRGSFNHEVTVPIKGSGCT
jgi:inner membrane protein